MQQLPRHGRADYLVLADELELAILSGTLPGGTRLPSLRELAAKRGVTSALAHRALVELCRRELAESRQGAGFFVASKRASAAKGGALRISVLHHRPERGSHDLPYCSQVLKGIQEEAARRGITLVLHYDAAVMEYDGRVERYVAEAPNEADALILLGSFDMIERHFDVRLPRVGVSMRDMLGGMLSPVDMDPWEAARLAAEYFRRNGIRKLVLCRPARTLPTLAFSVMRAVWDGECEICLLQNGVELSPVPGAGYWFEDCGWANGRLKRYRARTGRDFRRDHPLVALNGKNLLNPDYEPMNTIAPDWILAGRMALNEAVRRVREPGGGAARILLNCCFVPCDAAETEK